MCCSPHGSVLRGIAAPAVAHEPALHAPQAHTLKLLHTLRERIPGLALRTTFISGVPGEHCCCALCAAVSALRQCAAMCSSRQGKQPAPGPATRRCVALRALPWLALLLQPAACHTPCIRRPAGESEEQHRELVDFCTTFKFERMGCFQYSEEDGTPAAELPEQVRAAVRCQVQFLVWRCSSTRRRRALQLCVGPIPSSLATQCCAYPAVATGLEARLRLRLRLGGRV